MERVIELKQDVKIKDRIWKAGRYKVPNDMASVLADWLLRVRSDITELVSSAPPKPERIEETEGKPDLIEYMQEAMTEAQKFKREGGSPPHEIVKKPEEKPANEARPTTQKIAPVAPAPATNYKKLLELADGGDYLEFFASAGHGKSRFLAFIALEVLRAGKRVMFLDCEHSLPKRIQKELGNSYKRLDFMNLDGLVDAVAKLPDGLDLICFDSIGFPVLINYAKMNMKQRGEAILKTILLRGYMKHYAENFDVLALGANQPKSEMWGAGRNIEKEDLEEETPPVGGKSIHIAKGVIRMSVESKKEGESIFGMRAFECQDLPFNKLLATFTINEQGEKLEWKN